MWSQLYTQEGILYETTCPLVLSLKVKEQLEGVTAIWCKCSSFFGDGCLEGCCAVHTYPATSLVHISIPLAIQRSIRVVIDSDAGPSGRAV